MAQAGTSADQAPGAEDLRPQPCLVKQGSWISRSSLLNGLRPAGKHPAQLTHGVSCLAGLNISFHDLSYSVKVGIRRETKQILRGLYGEFRAGELTAIMGPSGAGKSTLLNVLAGYTVPGVQGSILLNNIKCELGNLSSYILQDDALPAMLTVEESMHVAAILKLGTTTTTHMKDQVERIIEALGLVNCRAVQAGRLSGGQRKRLAIALELVNDPPVMFFDEPTSGLDSSTSKQCVEVMKELASAGRTIVCTIHQPSASLFEMFDHVYVVVNGQCLYTGVTSSLVHFLREQRLACPQYHNPSDFFLEVASLDEYKSFIPHLVEAIDGGKCEKWRKSNTPNVLLRKLDEVPGSERRVEGECSRMCGRHTYAASFWTQLATLIIRSYRQMFRDQFPVRLRVSIHVFMALLLGTLFFDIGNDGYRTRDNYNLMFFSIMFIMFSSYSSAVSFYPAQLPIIAREHFNNWYSLKSFFIAANLSEEPVQIVCTLLYFTIVYFMTSQPPELARFTLSICTMVLTSLVSESFGYLIGCNMSITNASIFGPLVICPFIVFSGFFVKIPDAPVSFQWLFSLSYFKYAFHAQLQSIYGFDRPKLPCDETDFCLFRVPDKFLKLCGMDGGSLFVDWTVLLAIFFLLRLLAYCSLVIRIKYIIRR